MEEAAIGSDYLFIYYKLDRIRIYLFTVRSVAWRALSIWIARRAKQAKPKTEQRTGSVFTTERSGPAEIVVVAFKV